MFLEEMLCAPYKTSSILYYSFVESHQKCPLTKVSGSNIKFSGLRFCCFSTKAALFSQFIDSVLESYQGPSWRADLQLSICATMYWLSLGTPLLSLLVTGTCQTCADMDPCQTDLCLKEGQDVVTVSFFKSLLFDMLTMQMDLFSVITLQIKTMLFKKKKNQNMDLFTIRIIGCCTLWHIWISHLVNCAVKWKGLKIEYQYQYRWKTK